MKRKNIARRSRGPLFVLPAVMVLMLFMYGSIAQAQTRQRTRSGGTSSKTVTGVAPTKNFTLYSGSPVTYKAFTMDELQDPSTGKKLSEVSTITTKTGIRMKPSEYLSEINQLEKSLNEVGVSLRTGPYKVTMYIYEAPKPTLTMQSTSFQESLVAKPTSIRKMRTKGTKKSGASSKTSSSSKTAYASITYDTWEKEWEQTYGDEETFEIGLSAAAKLEGGSNYLEAEGSALVKASVFKKDITLASAKAYVYMTGDDRKEKLQFTMKVLGEELPGSFKTEFEIPDNIKEGKLSAGDSWKVADIPIAGAIPLTLVVRVGYSVDAKYAIGYDLDKLEVFGDAELSASATAEADLKLDLKVVEARVEGTVQIVTYTGTLLNSLAYADGKLDANSSLCHSISALNGSLTGHVEGQAWPFKKLDLEWEIFSWDGFTIGEKCSWVID